ncbi:MAG TPA: DUF1800 domain-containing protein [Acidobacteriaceae bacterium]|nr:DUF1800 domain-containing protein [Acidobacteriaceae bacterium]
MVKQRKFLRLVCETGKAAVAATLCALMTAGPMLGEAPAAAKTIPAVPALKSLTEQQKALHALNRFTFGPRTGDVQAVEKMGLKVWFEQQLNPASIDDSAFQTMMLKFPAMQLSQEELLKKFPSPQMLKQMARQGAALPSDPVEHAIYADGILSYEQKIAAAGASPQLKPKQAGAVEDGQNAMTPAMGGAVPASGAAAAPDMAAGDDMAAATPAAKVRKRGPKEAYTGDDPESIVALPPDERMAKILAMTPEQAIAFRQDLRPRERGALMAGLSPEQGEVLVALQGPIRVVSGEALETRLLRDVYSDRQLEAVMTDFWLNHFSVYVRKNQNEPYLLASYERDTIQPHALGKFEDLLVATAQSPAMLMYLDNWQSIGPNSPAAERGKRFSRNRPNSQLAKVMPKGINENYARELMELHTIGVQCEVSKDHTARQLDPACGPGYTQADITNVARALTGWTIDRPYQGGGGFMFAENRHDPGTKQVLGRTIQAGGENEGLEVLHMLATSPATAKFISHKLAVRFVSDNPPQALVDRMAATFLKTDGDIKAVLRTMFDAPEFWSPKVYRAKVKTPIEFLVSALRASDATVNNALPLVQAMDRLGMPLYGMQTPNGYSWLAPEWVSTTALVSRMNFAMVLSGGLLPGTRTNWPGLLGETAAGSTVPSLKTEQQLEMLLLGQPAADRTTTAVMELADRPGQVVEAQKNLGLGAGEAGPSLMNVKVAGKRPYANRGGPSMADLASNSMNEGPVTTMAGLLLGSPDFQRR